MASIWAGSKAPKLNHAGILALDGSFGHRHGAPIGLLATSGEGHRARRTEAQLLFDRLAAAAPERQTSRNIMEWIANSSPVRTARNVMQHVAAERSTRHLSGKEVGDCVEVIDGASGVVFDLDVAEAPSGSRTSALRDAAVHDLLPGHANDRQHRAVAFIERSNPSILAVLAERRRDRWTVRRIVELPPRPVTRRRVALEAARQPRAERRAARAAQPSLRRELMKDLETGMKLFLTD